MHGHMNVKPTKSFVKEADTPVDPPKLTHSECKSDALPIEPTCSVMSGHKTVNIYDRIACGSLPDINNSCLAAPQRNVLTLWCVTTPIGVVTSKVAFYIFIQQIYVLNILNMVYPLRFFPPSKCSLFHNSNVFGFCLIHILYTECAKI